MLPAHFVSLFFLSFFHLSWMHFAIKSTVVLSRAVVALDSCNLHRVSECCRHSVAVSVLPAGLEAEGRARAGWLNCLPLS